MLDERNDVAAPAAASTVPKSLFEIDAEPVGPVANEAWAGPFGRAHALEAGAERLGCRHNVGVAGSRNEVGVDHGRRPFRAVLWAASWNGRPRSREQSKKLFSKL